MFTLHGFFHTLTHEGRRTPGGRQSVSGDLQALKYFILLQAYCFCGETLLAEDQCGKAIRAMQESDKCEHVLPFLVLLFIDSSFKTWLNYKNYNKLKFLV